MRKLVLMVSAVPLFAAFAWSQVDVAVGIGTIRSSTSYTASEVFLPPSEQGGTYPSFSLGVALKNRIGFNGEVAVRSDQSFYNGYQAFRPIFYDFNAVYSPRIRKKIVVDVMAGLGGERTIFSDTFNPCTYPNGCTGLMTSNHFLAHFGGDVRYYFWRRFFVRPEAHFYLIHNNSEFSSGNLGRFGVSIGYTFRPK